MDQQAKINDAASAVGAVIQQKNEELDTAAGVHASQLRELRAAHNIERQAIRKKYAQQLAAAEKELRRAIAGKP